MKKQKHTVEVVVDRLVVGEKIRSRLADSVEIASKLAGGLVVVNIINGEDMLFSQNYACPEHGISIEELSPRMFSFNNPMGACPHCTGLGIFMRVDPDLIITDWNKTVRNGGIRGSGWAMEGSSIATMYFEGLSEHYKFSLDTPLKDLPKEIIDILLYGTNGENFWFTESQNMAKALIIQTLKELLIILNAVLKILKVNGLKKKFKLI